MSVTARVRQRLTHVKLAVSCVPEAGGHRVGAQAGGEGLVGRGIQGVTGDVLTPPHDLGPAARVHVAVHLSHKNSRHAWYKLIRHTRHAWQYLHIHREAPGAVAEGHMHLLYGHNCHASRPVMHMVYNYRGTIVSQAQRPSRALVTQSHSQLVYITAGEV